MTMWAFPVFGCALLASGLLLRRWPLAALAVTLGGAVAIVAVHSRVVSAVMVVLAFAAGLEICYMAATRARRVSVSAVIMAVGVSLLIRLPGAPPGGSIQVGSAPGIPTVTIVVLVIAIIAWLIGHSIQQAQTRAELLRNQAATQTELAERLRIARELHDMVAHSIGVIAIQAGSGRSVFDARPDEARDALAAIEAASR
jgi:signal transduction histidine kinase